MHFRVLSSEGILAFHRANPRLRFFNGSAYVLYRLKARFRFYRANARLRFIEREYVCVLSSDRTLAFLSSHCALTFNHAKARSRLNLQGNADTSSLGTVNQLCSKTSSDTWTPVTLIRTHGCENESKMYQFSLARSTRGEKKDLPLDPDKCSFFWPYFFVFLKYRTGKKKSSTLLISFFRCAKDISKMRI